METEHLLNHHYEANPRGKNDNNIFQFFTNNLIFISNALTAQ